MRVSASVIKVEYFQHVVIILSMNLFQGIKKPPPLFPLGDMECPDRRTACVGDQVSCCQMPQGKWGCCKSDKGVFTHNSVLISYFVGPFANAVCCANLKYCCPANTTCSMLRDQCYKVKFQHFTCSTTYQF